MPWLTPRRLRNTRGVQPLVIRDRVRPGRVDPFRSEQFQVVIPEAVRIAAQSGASAKRAASS